MNAALPFNQVAWFTDRNNTAYPTTANELAAYHHRARTANNVSYPIPLCFSVTGRVSHIQLQDVSSAMNCCRTLSSIRVTLEDISVDTATSPFTQAFTNLNGFLATIAGGANTVDGNFLALNDTTRQIILQHNPTPVSSDH